MAGRLGMMNVDCKIELDPAERNETQTVSSVFDCEAKQAKEREDK